MGAAELRDLEVTHALHYTLSEHQVLVALVHLRLRVRVGTALELQGSLCIFTQLW